MTLEIRIPPEMENHVRESALAAGQDVQTFVIDAVQARLQPDVEKTPLQPQDDWETQFLAWVASHPRVDHEVDDSRETLYDDRGL